MYEETTEKLLEFISKSPTAFQAAEETRRRFFGGRLYRIEGRGALGAGKGRKIFCHEKSFRDHRISIPVNDCRRYHIIASHSDSPSLK